MDDLHDFEHPALSDVLGDVRTFYRRQPPDVAPALAEFFEAAPKPHRSSSMRRVLSQLVAATTVVVAATGGLAVAGALPAPVQDAVSDTAENVGVELPEGEDSTPTGDDADTPTTDDESTTQNDGTDSDNAESEDAADPSTHPDNHGAEVSAVARDKTLQGCEHGRAVSSVASGKVNDKPCPHTDEAATAPTTVVPETPEAQPAPESTTEPKGKSQSERTKPGRGKGHGRGH